MQSRPTSGFTIAARKWVEIVFLRQREAWQALQGYPKGSPQTLEASVTRTKGKISPSGQGSSPDRSLGTTNLDYP